jgi:hypothetical protein
MRKLSKEQIKKKVILLASLKISALTEEKFKKDRYNTKIKELNQFIDDIRSDMQDYYDERSEKWQESDNGQMYQDWIDQWDNCYLEVDDFLEVNIPEDFDLPDEP